MKIDQTTGSTIPLRPATKGVSPATPVAIEGPAAHVAAGGTVIPFPRQDEESFDMAKVAAIKAAIRAGTYQIDPERIADSMIASARDLLAKGK